ncbi:hypothetical protein FB565_007989 [Actinoplanes lutulentus]|uniref:Uncharacterized protein n=1 Tax=Actinoplanes lutulentus TaxID=1287878 RepID=A0A327Z6C4_9ACTN|nr:hypothetical protein [Actinoplanes lutulentus]MBB2948206.1 hypothetical protein [Actinoplanes lutulentus]RAK31294.1 hypothetical protein B0I29_115100 [Actinoplanes lutulentus]
MTDDGIALRQQALNRIAEQLGVPAPVWTEEDEARFTVWTRAADAAWEKIHGRQRKRRTHRVTAI